MYMTNLVRFLGIRIDLPCFRNRYLSFGIYCVLYIVFVYILHCVSLCFLYHRSAGSSTDRLQGKGERAQRVMMLTQALVHASK